MIPDISILPTVTREINENVVKTIKNALAKAEAGEIQGVFICGVSDDGTTHMHTSKIGNKQALVGHVTMCWHQLIEDVNSGFEEDERQPDAPCPDK